MTRHSTTLLEARTIAIKVAYHFDGSQRHCQHRYHGWERILQLWRRAESPMTKHTTILLEASINVIKEAYHFPRSHCQCQHHDWPGTLTGGKSYWWQGILPLYLKSTSAPWLTRHTAYAQESSMTKSPTALQEAFIIDDKVANAIANASTIAGQGTLAHYRKAESQKTKHPTT